MLLANILALGLTSPPSVSKLAVPKPAITRVATTDMATPTVSRDFCYGLSGVVAPFGRGFDPLNLLQGKKLEQVRVWREVELTHGRVGMLASAGFLVQEFVHPLFSGVGGPAIKQMPQLPLPLWFGMILGIGIVEGHRINIGFADPTQPGHFFQRLKPGYENGDLGFDPFSLKPNSFEGLRKMQARELNNGRLAMLAAAGFLAQEAVTGDTWGAYWNL